MVGLDPVRRSLSRTRGSKWVWKRTPTSSARLPTLVLSKTNPAPTVGYPRRPILSRDASDSSAVAAAAAPP